MKDMIASTLNVNPAKRPNSKEVLLKVKNIILEYTDDFDSTKIL